MAFSRPTIKELQDRIVGDIEVSTGQTVPLLKRAFLRVLAKVFAGVAHLLYGFMIWISRQTFVDTAEAENLDRIASFYGITRKPASFASGNIQVTTSVDGIAIPEGTRWQAPSGIEYELETGVIVDDAGNFTIQVTALQSGDAGNVATDEKIIIVSPISGMLTEATVLTPGITGGFNEESDDELRQRVLDRIQSPPQGGSVTDYIRWAKEVAGVTRVWVYGNFPGIGEVFIVFTTDNAVGGIIPDGAKVTEVQDYIDERRPVTANVNVDAPVLKPVNFTIDLTPDTPETRDAVIAELDSYFALNGNPDITIPLSQLNEAISKAEGETDHNMTVPAAPIVVAKNEIPVRGTMTWL
jgi:uncharacterized phage protein gp47/JayE